MTWIDVSVGITDGMPHWPDNPPVRVERALSIQHGDAANVSKISLGVHTATHMDAPVHFDPGGASIDQMPFEAGVGPARVIEIKDPVHITETELSAHAIRPGERILLKTRNSPRAWRSKTFVEDAVHLNTDAARYLANAQVMTVGIDYLSVGGYRAQNGESVHHALLDAGIWIIEGLDLTHVPAGPCELVCLPIKLVGCDGAPARAFIRPGGTNG